MKKTTEKSMPKGKKFTNKDEVDVHKVRKAMKRQNVKKLDKETVQMIAKELNYPLSDIQHERHLRGKMLATVRHWDRYDD